MTRRKAQRGQKPSIGLATSKLQEIRRALKSLVTEISSVEQHLKALDGFYAKTPAPAIAPASRRSRPSRRSPNVRDLAYQILSKVKRGLPVTELSKRVAKMKGGRVGAQFAKNLGTCGSVVAFASIHQKLAIRPCKRLNA